MDPLFKLCFSDVWFPFRRVMELLVQDWSLSAKLRLPAISRLQKVHNVEVAMQVLKSKNVDLKDELGEYYFPPKQRQKKKQTLNLKQRLPSTR
mgnify:CR=1 FL=1